MEVLFSFSPDPPEWYRPGLAVLASTDELLGRVKSDVIRALVEHDFGPGALARFLVEGAKKIGVGRLLVSSPTREEAAVLEELGGKDASREPEGAEADWASFDVPCMGEVHRLRVDATLGVRSENHTEAELRLLRQLGEKVGCGPAMGWRDYVHWTELHDERGPLAAWERGLLGSWLAKACVGGWADDGFVLSPKLHPFNEQPGRVGGAFVVEGPLREVGVERKVDVAERIRRAAIPWTPAAGIIAAHIAEDELGMRFQARKVL